MVLSIIVPSYNTSGFMEKNLITFYRSELLNKVEVLIIDDGSKDNTLEIAKAFEEKYPGYYRAIHKQNGGHGSAINEGIKHAKGKYFKVVDGDDWVETKNLVRLVHDLECVDVDLVINQYYCIGEKTGRIQLCGTSPITESILSYKKALSFGLHAKIHSITYRTKMFTHYSLKLTEHCFYEDFQYVLFGIPYISNVICFNYPVYDYLTEQKSQSVSDSSSYKNIQMFVTVLHDSVKYIDSITIKSCFRKKEVLRQLLIYIRQIYNVFLKNVSESSYKNHFSVVNASIYTLSPFLYYLSGLRYPYILLMRLNSERLNKVLSILLRFYKRVK